jgi:hypothetical protein
MIAVYTAGARTKLGCVGGVESSAACSDDAL